MGADIMVNIKSQELFVKEMSDYIFSRLSGSHEDDAITDEKPSKRFLLGTLAAKRRGIDSDDENDLVQSHYLSGETKSSIRAQRQSVSILVNKKELEKVPQVKILVSGSVYSQIKKEKGEPVGVSESNNKEIPDGIFKWKKVEFNQEWNLGLKQETFKDIDFSGIREKSNRDPSIRAKVPDDIWQGKISINVKDFDSDNSLVTFSFENTGRELDFNRKSKDSTKRERDFFERTFFNCKLTVDLNDLTISEFSDKYIYEGHKQRYYYDFRPINCQVEWEIEKRMFFTTYVGRYIQENISPKELLPNVDLSFSSLMKDESLVPTLRDLVLEMKKYLEIYKNNLPENKSNEEFQPRQGKKEVTWEERLKLIEQFEHLLKKIESSVDLIDSDEDVRASFLKTNEVFKNYYESVGTENAGWRLFQVAFLVSSIQSVVKKSDLDIVDVLHVDTGGGKSEAYFGLVIFTSFYERITGKKEGVSAIVKFPLRMLSIQQLERISSVIAHGESVRRKHEEKFPGEPFSLGYYVGNTDEFPDFYGKIRKNLYNDGNLITPAPESIILSKCPLCPGDNRGTVRLHDDQDHRRLIHMCDKCGNKYYIYQSDREVFRWRPTVVVSTVDKWAALSLQRRIRNLLGGMGSDCPMGHGFIPSGDKCEEKSEEEFQCDQKGENLTSCSGPILSIQDEMHLLREGFGTISSHFEGLIENVVNSTSDRNIKHISMSATLNGTDKQIKQLYNKRTFVIPGRCPEGVGSSSDFFSEKKEGPKRIIYGLKPNLRDNHYAVLRTLLHHIEYIVDAQKNLNKNPSEFKTKFNLTSKEEAQELIEQYLIPLTYHLKKQDAYDMERLKEPVIGDYIKLKKIGHIGGTTLTGDCPLEDLKKVISEVKKHIEDYDPQSSETGDVNFEPIFATSVVSHGIDLDELNFMAFQGIPYSTSEYIQALSRVGRKHLGVIFLWFYPNRVRDDSFYRNFKRYHDSLDHQVKPVPINRFARLGLYQTINSLFCAGILTFLSNKYGRPLYHKSDIKQINNAEDKRELVDFIMRCYGRKSLEINVTNEVEERIKQIVLSDSSDTKFFPHILADSGDYYYRTQTGMRGIQKKLALGLKEGDETKLKGWRS